MSLFKVEEIINGSTIKVSPDWNISNESGSEVIIRGYSPMFSKYISIKWNDKGEKQLAELLAKKRLEFLLTDKFVELKNSPTETGDCVISGKAKCRVYLNDVDISKYFPDFN